MTGHVIVVDLGYGDAGKGGVVDWLCSQPGPARTVVRFNGGAQAAHNVVTADGRHHTFAQFGSGTFHPGVRTHLSRFMLVDPLALAAEAGRLAAVGVGDALDRLTVDRAALLTTPYHRAANLAREAARGAGRHGSCGMGIGETARHALAHPQDAPAAKLTLLRDRLIAEVGPLRAAAVADLAAAYRAFADRVTLTGPGYLTGVLRAGPVVFEGAQGVLLDEWHGFHPYTTWSTTTFANAETLLTEAGATALRLGVTRCYQTRHGPGPLVTEDPTLELPEQHNQAGRWQGPFRRGHLDAVALRYAIEAAGGVDAIALTHLDAARYQPLRLCESYLAARRRVDGLPVRRDRYLARQERLTRALLRCAPRCGPVVRDWPAAVRDALGAPVALVSAGPTATATTVLGTLDGAGYRSRSTTTGA